MLYMNYFVQDKRYSFELLLEKNQSLICFFLQALDYESKMISSLRWIFERVAVFHKVWMHLMNVNFFILNNLQLLMVLDDSYTYLRLWIDYIHFHSN